VLILTLLNPATDNKIFKDDIRLRANQDYGYNFTDSEPVCTLCSMIGTVVMGTFVPGRIPYI